MKERLDCVHKSYDIAMELMHYFLIYPPNSIMNCEKVEQGHKKRQKICDVDLDILGNLIVTCRKNEIISFFDDIQRKITGIDGVTLEYIHIFTIEVLSCYIIAIKSISLEISDILKDYESLFSNVLKQNTINGILASMKHISIEITDGIYQQKENPKTLVDQIMEYINANFQRIDLSIKVLSTQFNVNAPYLGQLLKKETGVLFSDYLNGIRINKAKVLLAGTCFKANEISERMGYTDSNYFYRIFKKYTGLYPTEYRENNSK